MGGTRGRQMGRGRKRQVVYATKRMGRIESQRVCF